MRAVPLATINWRLPVESYASFRADFTTACVQAPFRNELAVAMAKNSSDCVAYAPICAKRCDHPVGKRAHVRAARPHQAQTLQHPTGQFASSSRSPWCRS